MDAPKVTRTTICDCGRGEAPHGPGVVNPGVCPACFHDAAVSFWNAFGGGVVPPLPVRKVKTMTDHQRDWGF
jgi:hypothetical protein